MWATEYTVMTDASPAAVWRLLGDVDGWGAWNDGIESIALGGPFAVGTTFRMKPPGEEELVSTIAELEPGELLTDVTELGDLVVRVAHRLQPLAGGGTVITYAVQVTGPAADTTGAQVGAAVSADFPVVMAALAAAARGPAPAGSGVTPA